MSSQNSLLLAHVHLKEFILSGTVVFQLDILERAMNLVWGGVIGVIKKYVYNMYIIYIHVEHILGLEVSKWLYIDVPWKKVQPVQPQ